MSVLSHQTAVNPTLNFWDVAGDTSNSTKIQYVNAMGGGVFSNTTPIVLNTTTFTATFAGKICVVGTCGFTATSANNVPMSVTLSKTNAPTVSAVGTTTLFAQQNENVACFLTFNVAVGDTVNLSYTVTGALNTRYAHAKWVVYYCDA
jgi:hypothetical protein